MRRPQVFWIIAIGIVVIAVAGYGVLKTRQVLAAFDMWQGQDIGPAPGAAK